jgi:hypothetical protein
LSISATAPAATMVSNMCSSSIPCSASDNSATSYDGASPYDSAAAINPAAVIAAASAIFVGGIAGAAMVRSAYDCPPSNHRSATIHGASPTNCNTSVN